MRGRTDDEATLKALEVDYMPPGAALAFMMMLADLLKLSGNISILDPSAGSGVFGRAARVVFPRAFLRGNDIRASEEENLEAAYDYSEIMAFDELRGGDYDLIVTNPPFRAAFTERWWIKAREHGLLSKGGAVALIGLTQWGQGQGHWPALCEWSPWAQIRCGGRLGFRPYDIKRREPIPEDEREEDGPEFVDKANAQDQNEISMWIWRDGYGHNVDLPEWKVIQMPRLDQADRRWRSADVPGLAPIDVFTVLRVTAAIRGGRAT
jgi:hypothetical protein